MFLVINHEAGEGAGAAKAVESEFVQSIQSVIAAQWQKFLGRSIMTGRAGKRLTLPCARVGVGIESISPTMVSISCAILVILPAEAHVPQ